MLHGTSLYGWTGDELMLIDINAYNLYYMSDDSLFFMTTNDIEFNNKTIKHSEIFMIECKFGNFAKSQVYKDRNLKAEILNFGIDNTRKRIIILTGIKNIKNKRDKFITIFDIETDKQLYQIRIKNREIIGRLKSNLYNLVEGHIYYNNSVIKIRYDLLISMKGEEIKESQLFDYYHDILSLKNKGEDFIQSGTPLQTCLYNRLAYVIRNRKKLLPRKLLILPYLHERRIYLNRRHKQNQFYTLLRYNA